MTVARFYPAGNSDDPHVTAAMCQQIRSYVDWLPMHPDLNSVARVYMQLGIASGAVNFIAPAPFCCSRKLYHKWVPNTAIKPLKKKKLLQLLADGDGQADDDDGDGGDVEDGKLVLSTPDEQMDTGTCWMHIYVWCSTHGL